MNRQVVSAVAAVFAALLLTACSGCGPKRPDTATVVGRVTYQGKPVVEGTIVFQPEHGRPAMGTIGSDGSYSLTTFAADNGSFLVGKRD